MLICIPSVSRSEAAGGCAGPIAPSDAGEGIPRAGCGF